MIPPEFLLEEYGGLLKENWESDKENLLSSDKKMKKLRERRMKNVITS